MISRRQFLSIALALAAPGAAAAQPPGKVTIGVLGAGVRSAYDDDMNAFRQALRELGHGGQREVTLIERWAEGLYDRLPELATELVRLNVRVILASGGTPAVIAAQKATAEIPIVFPTAGNPLGQKLVKTLGRPGGNVTGLSLMNDDLAAKRVALLKQVFPNAVVFGAVTNRSNPAETSRTESTQITLRSLKVQMVDFDVRAPDDFDRVFTEIARQRLAAVIVGADTVVTSHYPQVFRSAMKHRVPALAGGSTDVPFFMSLGADRRDLYRRAATYVDKILRGASPADLPVEQPTKFTLAVNLKTAKALGLTIPPSVLLQAERVIE